MNSLRVFITNIVTISQRMVPSREKRRIMSHICSLQSTSSTPISRILRRVRSRLITHPKWIKPAIKDGLIFTVFSGDVVVNIGEILEVSILPRERVSEGSEFEGVGVFFF